MAANKKTTTTGTEANPKSAEHENSNAEKPPSEWTTGDEEMTGAQASYLKTLSEQAGEPFDGSLTKAQASVRIEELQEITGREARTRSRSGQASRPYRDAVIETTSVSPRCSPAAIMRVDSWRVRMSATPLKSDSSISRV